MDVLEGLTMSDLLRAEIQDKIDLLGETEQAKKCLELAGVIPFRRGMELLSELHDISVG